MPRADATFYGPHKLTNTAATLATSPAAGSKWIIRHIHFNNTDSSARTVTLSIGADAVDVEILTGKTIAANDVYDWYGIIEVPASTAIQGFASVTNVVTITISGTLNTP
jgi:hypothetical protein